MARQIWVIVLAAGDGTRLRAVATDARGICTPKQFLSFGAPRSLLRTTLDRARGIADAGRIVTVVAANHEPWWRREMATASLGTVLVQPRNAGTAAGLLLPVLSILAEDPDALVVVLPSDHHVADEEGFSESLQQLAAAARRDVTKTVLLGMKPDGPEIQYGWIVPSASASASGSGGPTHAVEAFIEKPRPAEAATLLQRGALWSTFVMAASVTALWGLFQRATPALASRFEREAQRDAGFARDADRLRALYDGLEPADFSAGVLQHAACRDMLRVMPSAACGWTDLGTPERLARVFPRASWAIAPASVPSGPLPLPRLASSGEAQR